MFDLNSLYPQNVDNAEFISANYTEIKKANDILRDAFDEIRKNDLLVEKIAETLIIK